MLFAHLQTYLILINAVGFLIMLLDKQKARRGGSRIPERTLLGTAIIGGSIGVTAAMYLFRHKTKHTKFSIGLPVILMLQAVAILWIICSLT